VAEADSDPKVEIAPVLTMDVVEHSTLLINEQSRLMGELTRVIKETPRFLTSDNSERRRAAGCYPRHDCTDVCWSGRQTKMRSAKRIVLSN
jgi:hypothetical protein